MPKRFPRGSQGQIPWLRSISLLAACIGAAWLGSACDGLPGAVFPPNPVTLPETVLPDPDGTDEPITQPQTPGSTVVTLSFTTEAVFCCNPLTVQFTAETTDATFERRAKFEWDFGDGRTAVGQTVRHTYPWPGEYPVVLSAIAIDGRSLDTRRQLKLSIDEGGRLDAEVGPGKSPSEEVDPGSLPPIEEPNGSLLADAGPDQRVLSGERVVLLGHARGAESMSDITYQWKQRGGRPVQLSAPGAPLLTFLAPSVVLGPESLIFELTVTSGEMIDADEVTVFILGVQDGSFENAVPVVLSNGRALVRDEPVLLTLTGEDADGDALTFSIVVPPTRGHLGPVQSVSATSATVLYTPPANFEGTELFLFRADDGRAASTAARFTLQIVGREAELSMADATYLAFMNRTVEIQLKVESSLGANVDFEVVAGPRRGTLGPIQPIGNGTAKVSYTPPDGFKGTEAFEVKAVGQVSESNVATIAVLVQPLLVPWLEVNWPLGDATAIYTREQGAQPGMTQLDYCLAGLESWAKVTDTVIITTRVEEVEKLYVPLMARKPAHLRIIGGVKSMGIPGGTPGDTRPYDFTNEAEWLRITAAVSRTAAITGMNIVVLENETALRKVMRGEESIDLDKLASTLEPLMRTGIETWSWVPWVLSNFDAFPDRQDFSRRFVTAFSQALPQNVFMTDYVSWYGWQNSPLKRENRSVMYDTVGDIRVQDGLFVTVTGWMEPEGERVRCYTPAEALGQFHVLADDLLRIYPGGQNWILTSREFARLLPPLAGVTTH